ncbi:hypothetical protein RND81_14G022000 [Saponaria officinalis]|uniref:Uncharacterized protein n=1 Tax=Saponaria officinalis TaxID=3572 RepID=A0AAW1GKV6_SAPOF
MGLPQKAQMASFVLPSLSLLRPSSSSSSPLSLSLFPHSLSTTATTTTLRTSTAATALTRSISIASVGVGEDLTENYDEYLPKGDMSDRQRAGILLHPTSLSGPHGLTNHHHPLCSLPQL